MKFNECWLREWVDPALDTAALSARLTMAGLEVDAVDPVAAPFSGVVVGEIVTIAPHPDADKLRVCQVTDGRETVQVVCGAPNARAGLRVPFARLDARLPGDLTIRKAKLRGVESFGMLCAAAELGLEDATDGLLELPADAPVGQDIRAYLELDDRVFEIGLTPNRADCLSLAGIAREVAVISGAPVRAPAIEPVPAAIDAVLPVNIEAPEHCPRYVGRVIRNVDVSRPAPQWLRERLRRCGVRSIDPVVDVTNYVMLELGQPMHAFDFDRLAGGIRVRLAEPGERLEALDGQQLELRADTLVIADRERPLALAGVMGGRPSAVAEGTRHIFLESAFFAPDRIAGRARSYGLHTESSHRFERGVDPQLQVRAIERATRLILDIVGGEAGPVIEVATPALPRPAAVSLRRRSVGKLLGIELADAEVENTLEALGLQWERTAEGWNALPPSWRFDIAIEVDLLEELARIYGYNRLPVRSIRSELPIRPRPEAGLGAGELRRLMAGRGYQEAITYSFVDPQLQQLLEPSERPVMLRNPISSDMAAMRTTLWAGLLNTVRHNLNRQQSRVRLFEIGLRFVPASEGLRQEPMLAAAITGRRFAESWSAEGASVDFYDLKGDLEALLKLAGLAGGVAFLPGSHPALHPGQSADLYREGRLIGRLGALHPELQRELDIGQAVYLLEVELSGLAGGALPRFSELSKFPEVRRDLAVVVDRSVPAEALLSAVREAAGSCLRDLRLFDVYQGKGIDPQRKSLALGLTFQHSSRTLTEDEINTAITAVIDLLASRFEAILRT